MFSIFSPCMGIDLGTANTLVYMRGKGIVLREPSVVAMRSSTNEILAVGDEAKKMIGRTPGNIVAVKPMKDGVIADYTTTEIMLRYFLQKTVPQGMLLKRMPRLVMCIPCVVTEVEKRAVQEAAKTAGAREVYLLEEPMAAALGAGLDVYAAKGSMVVDIGGGTTEVAVISLGGIAASKSIRVGGNKMDEAIIKHVKETQGIIIGESTAEQIKIKIGSVVEGAAEKPIEVRGRDIETSLPTSVTVTPASIRQALSVPAKQIVAAVKAVLENTPPELAADIINEGIVLTGGASGLLGLNRLISKATGMPVRRAENPMDVVAIGAGIALDNMESRRDESQMEAETI